MKSIGVVTDSHSSITQAEARRLGIYVLPMPFYIDGQVYYEDITLSREDFFEKLDSGADISTSQPSPSEVMQLWDKALEEFRQILYIPISSGLSGSCATAAALAQSEGMFYIVTCEKNAIIDENGRNKFGEKVEDLIETKQVFKGDTVEELAEQIGVSPEVLQETFDKWQEACHTGVDGEFGRTSFAENVWLDEGPFYASIRTPAIHHTMGGVKVDADMHVIAEDGSVIPGLYAAGEVTGGIHGSNRLGANAVPDALSNGRVAGQNAADGK